LVAYHEKNMTKETKSKKEEANEEKKKKTKKKAPAKTKVVKKAGKKDEEKKEPQKEIKKEEILFDKEKLYPIAEAAQLVKTLGKEKFDASVETHFHLGINPKKGDQQIRVLFLSLMVQVRL